MRTNIHTRLAETSAEAILAAVLATILAALAGFAVTPGRAASVYTAPDGTRIEVNTAGPWTAEQVHAMLVENGLNAQIGATLTVRVQDDQPSSASVSARREDGRFVGANSVIVLQGIGSTFANSPDATLAHEFGHVWTLYHLYMTQQGDWGKWLETRGLVGDSRLDSSYAWSASEMIADDYRLVLGSALAVSQKPWYINPEVAHPAAVPGLREFFNDVWAAQPSVPVPTAPVSPQPTGPTSEPSIAASPPAETPVPTPRATPSPASTPTPTPSVPSTSSPEPTATPTWTPEPPQVTPTPSPVLQETLVQGIAVNPSPVRRMGEVAFSLAARSTVHVTISNGMGEVVRQLARTEFGAGTWALAWDRTNDRGQRVPKGTYVVQVVAGSGGAADTDVVSVSVR